MNLVTKTIYYDDMILAHFRGKSFEPLPNTTLNEKFNINKDITSEIENPTLKYFAIGNGNAKVIDSEESLSLYHGNHSVIDGALFNHIPFVVRRLDLDLTTEEKRNYRLRKVISIENINYVAYYLKVIPDDSVRNQLLKITTDDSSLPKIETFNTNNSSILNPVSGSTSRLVSEFGTEYITNSDQIDIELTINELRDIKNGLAILGYNDDDSIINEIALCSGTDIVNMSDFSTEVAYSQVMFFVDTDFDLQLMLAANEEGLFRQVEVGGMNALTLN